GIGLAWMTVGSVVRLAPPGLPRISNVSINASTISLALAMGIITSLLFGLIPVAKQLPMAREILSGSRGTTASREQRRLQDALAIVQVVLAAVLLVCSGLMVRTFIALGRDNPGYVASDVQTLRVAISPSDISDDDAVLRHEQDLQHRLEAIPGVSGVALG